METAYSTTDLPCFELVREAANRRIKEQVDDIVTANSKAQFLLGFTGIAVGAAAKPTTPDWLAVAWIIPALITLLMALKAYRSGKYESGLNPNYAWHNLMTSPKEEAELKAVDWTIQMIEQNQPLIDVKNAWLERASASFILTVALMLACPFVHF